ncbi:Mut7-C RNAse domain-containing protein [Hydrogenimonas sp.]
MIAQRCCRYRFVCDVHLAGVAKYLRLLGFDTVYRNDITDDEIIGRCRFGRIGLTCDRKLQERLPQAVFLLGCEAPEKQIRRIDAVLDLASEALPFRRSLCCNRELVACGKDRGVPKETYRWLIGFWICPKCKKLYWRGTHVARMRQKIYELLGYREK